MGSPSYCSMEEQTEEETVKGSAPTVALTEVAEEVSPAPAAEETKPAE